MALKTGTGRYNDFKVYDTYQQKVITPSAVSIYDNGNLISLGSNNSYSTKQLKVYSNSTLQDMLYNGRDNIIYKYIELGTNKYINLTKNTSNYIQPTGTYYGGYDWTMKLVVNQTTPLYTSYVTNNGDIYQSFYYNIIAEVVGGQVRLVIGSRWYGKVINTGSIVNSKYTEKRTVPLFNVGQVATIKLSRSTNSGALTLEVWVGASHNTYTTDDQGRALTFATVLVTNTNIHRLGSKTTNDAGAQSTYGNARVLEFNHKVILSSTNIYGFNALNINDGTTSILNSAGTGAYGASCVGTSVQSLKEIVFEKEEIV